MTKAGSQMIANLFGAPESTRAPQKEEKIWQVSEVLAHAKRTLERQFNQVAIVGEISSFKPWRSGHWYFNLKDKNCSLNSIMFKNANQRVAFEVEEGQEVLARGRISIYPERSQVQFIVDRLEPLGAGALALAFEQLKKKLEKEGLFDSKQKKALPQFPQRIGLITSPQGAALRDMLRVMQQRWPGLEIILSPTKVQGPGAAQEIAKALALIDLHGKCDALIISRGGGSLEDLWAFNEEVLARAIHDTRTPIISAVGHATDTTIADYVADLSVATPTHAASLIPEKTRWQETLVRKKEELHQTVNDRIHRYQQLLELRRQQLPDPRLRILQLKQTIDDKERRAQQALNKNITAQKSRLAQQERRIKAQHPYQILRTQQNKLVQHHRTILKHSPNAVIQDSQRNLLILKQKLSQSMQKALQDAQQTLAVRASALETLSPLSVLSRGYALVQKKEGDTAPLVAQSSQLQEQDKVQIQFSDGTAEATITRILPRKDPS
jgi:exodeoxyribonuclease VII large subunit